MSIRANPLGLTKIGLAILTVMLIVCSDIFGFSMVVPNQTLVVASLGFSTEYVGLLASTYSACSFLSSLVMGKISDAYGRRTTFLVTGIGATLAYLGATVSQTFYQLLVFRALAGLLSGTVGNALAYLSDITSKEERAIYMSYISAIISACFIVGPMIGGGLAIYGLRYPYLGATVFSAIVVVLTYTSLQDPEALLMKKSDREAAAEDDNEQGEETRRVLMVKQKSFRQVYGATPASFSTKIGHSRKEGPASEITPLSAPTAVAEAAAAGGPWMDPMALVVGGLCPFLREFAFVAIMTTLPLILMEPSFGIFAPTTDAVSPALRRRLQKTSLVPMHGVISDLSPDTVRTLSLDTGYLVGSMGIIQTAGALVLFPFLVNRLGQLYTATAGAVCMSLGLLAMLAASSVSSLLPCLLALSLGSSLVGPVLTSHLSLLAPPGKNAEYLSFSGTFESLAWMFSNNMTFLYAQSRVQALGMIAVSGLVLSAVLGWLAYDEARKTLPDKDKEQDALEKLFGAGQELPQEQFFDELQIALIETIRERGWSRGLQTKKGQMILLELLVASVPQLPSEQSEKMHAMNELYRRNEDSSKEEPARGLVQMSREFSLRG